MNTYNEDEMDFSLSQDEMNGLLADQDIPIDQLRQMYQQVPSPRILTEPERLIDYGRHWSVYVRHNPSTELAGIYRDYITTELLTDPDFSASFNVRRGFWYYEPVVIIPGHRISTYQSIAMAANQDPQEDAKKMLKWINGETILSDLSKHLQDLAVITHFAEPARGFTCQDRELRVFLENIAQGCSSWGDIDVGDNYPPSIRYSDDTYWSPNMDDPVDDS